MKPVQYTGQQPIDNYGMLMPSKLYDATLAASTELTLTVPGDAPRWKAVLEFSTDSDVWVAVNNTATEPAAAGNPFAETDSMLNPKCIEVLADDVLHFITPDGNTVVSVALYAAVANN